MNKTNVHYSTIPYILVSPLERKSADVTLIYKEDRK